MFENDYYNRLYLPTAKQDKRTLEVELVDRFLTYLQEFTDQIASMIVYDDAPEDFNSYFFELYRIRDGKAFMIDDDGHYPAVFGSLAGSKDGKSLDYYGRGITATVTDLGGNIHFTNLDQDKYAICYNTPSGYPEYNNLMKYAYQLAHIETSIMCNVFNARYSNIIACANDSIKQTVEGALNQIMLGKNNAFVNSDLLKNLGDIIEGAKAVEAIAINDVGNADKIQYLSRLRDDMYRWLWTRYGINISGSTKLAQQTVDEITSSANLSKVYADIRMDEAIKFCDEANAKFGLNMKPRFNNAWALNMVEVENPELVEPVADVINNMEGVDSNEPDDENDPA